MEPKILKIIVALGVPGLALYVFYLLLKGFGFRFETIGATWAAVIVILFLFVVMTVTLTALKKWAPASQSEQLSAGFIERKSLTKDNLKVGLPVTISKLPQVSLELQDGFVKWLPSMNAFCGRRASVTSLSESGPPAVRLDIDLGKHWWSIEWLTL